MANRGDAQRPADDRRRGADVEPREGPAPQRRRSPTSRSSTRRPTPTGSAPGSQRAVAQVPRLRQRVVPALGRLAPPEWQDDPDFDLDYHLRRVGAARARARCASCSTSPPPSCGTPVRPHPAAVGVRRRRGPRGRPGRDDPEAAPHHHRRRGQHPHVGAVHRPRPRRHRADRARPPARPSRSTTQPRRDHRRHAHPPAAPRPRHRPPHRRGRPRPRCATRTRLVGAGGRRSSSSGGRRCARSSCPTRPARRCGRERSLRRRIEVLQVPLDDAKARRQGARRQPQRLLRRRRGRRRRRLPPRPGAAGRRAAHLDAGEHPHGRLRRRQRVHAHPGARSRSASRTRPSASPPSASGSTPPSTSRPWASSSAWPGIANLLPTSVAVRFARQQVETVDFTTSNVRGAPFPLYIAGARILGQLPDRARAAARRGTSR